MGGGKGVNLLRLARLPMSAMVSIAAVAGYALFPGNGGWRGGALVACGMMLLCAGCSALNQFFERDLDSQMERTRNRPLPRGALPTGTAFLFGTLLSAGALLLLFSASGAAAALLALVGSAVYLGLYTPLKRRTPFALLAGALSGAAPPLVGWSAAGGDFYALPPLLLAGILFLWQIPHYALLSRRFPGDLDRAGLCHMADSFERSAPALHLPWSAALCVALPLLPLFSVLMTHPALMLLAASWLLLLAAIPLSLRSPCLRPSPHTLSLSLLFAAVFVDGILTR